MGEDLTGEAGHLDLARLDLDLDGLHRQARDIQESFRASVEQRLSAVEEIRRRD